MGTDPFSNVKTHVRPWDVDSSLDTFLTRVDVAFEFFTKHLVYACLSRRTGYIGLKDVPQMSKSSCIPCSPVSGRLGVDYYCFHDVDVAPQGENLQERTGIGVEDGFSPRI